jgi:hypothetical protein
MTPSLAKCRKFMQSIQKISSPFCTTANVLRRGLDIDFHMPNMIATRTQDLSRELSG